MFSHPMLPTNRIFLVLVLVCTWLVALQGQAQPKSRANQWVFGKNAGLDFGNATGQPVPITNTAVDAEEGCATICDTNGQLLFYTDGFSNIWNRNHQVMANGDNMGGWFSVAQAALIIPIPGSDSLYFVFNNSFETLDARNLTYSVVDMSLQGGLGQVIVKNISLKPVTQEGMCAVKHANGIDFWLIVRNMNNNVFTAFLIDSTGIASSVESSFGLSGQPTNIALLKASPDGSTIAHCTHLTGWLDFYRFNNQTGVLSNPIFLNLPTISNVLKRPYGMSFSPDGSKFYFQAHGTQIGTVELNTNYTEIYQIDMTNYTSFGLVNSMQTIAGFTTDKLQQGPRFMLQTGPDGKIYTARENDNWLGAILCPNASGLACNFVEKYVNLGAGISQMGLANYPENWFYETGQPQMYIQQDQICAGSQVQVSVTGYGDNFAWQPDSLFDQPNSASTFFTLTQPTNISVTVTGNCNTQTLQRLISPLPQTPSGLTGPDTVWLCPEQTFNLPLASLPHVVYDFNLTNRISANSLGKWVYQAPKLSLGVSDTAIWRVTTTDTTTNCPTTDSLTIITIGQQNSLARGDTSVCPNAPFELIGTQLHSFSTLWLGQNITQPQQATTTATAANSTTDTLLLPYVFIQSRPGCLLTDTVWAAIMPAPPNTIQGPNTVCPGDTNVRFFSTLAAGGSSWWQTLPTPTPNPQADTLLISFGNTSGNTTTIRLQATTPQGCLSDTLTKQVVTNPTMQPQIVPAPDTLCLPGGEQATYSVANLNLNSRYQWQVANGTLLTPDTASTITVLWDTTLAQGYLSLSEAANTPGQFCAGQIDSMPVRWFYSPAMPPLLTGDTVICSLGDTALFSVLAPDSSSTYAWQLWPQPGAQWADSSSTNPQSTVWVNLPGRYTVGVAQINPYGCPSPQATLPLTTEAPTASISTADTLVCLPQLSGLFTLQLSDTNGTTLWRPYGGTLQPNATNRQAEVVFDRANRTPADSVGVWPLFTSAKGCQVLLPFLPVATDTTQPELTMLTHDTTTHHTNNLPWVYGLWQYNTTHLSNPQATAWLQQPGGNTQLGTFAPNDSIILELATNPPYTMYLEATNACNQPVASVVHQTMLLNAQGGGQSLRANLQWQPYQGWGNALSHYSVWQKTDQGPWRPIGQTNTTGFEINPITKGFFHQYAIMAHHQNGRYFSFSNTDTLTFTHPLTIPNIVTPNGDDLNDTWRIKNIEFYTDYSLTVYNRWGQPVLQTNNYTNNWPSSEASGVYYYLLTEKHFGQTYRGWVQIMGRPSN